jgi:hypothetical protein
MEQNYKISLDHIWKCFHYTLVLDHHSKEKISNLQVLLYNEIGQPQMKVYISMFGQNTNKIGEDNAPVDQTQF